MAAGRASIPGWGKLLCAAFLLGALTLLLAAAPAQADLEFCPPGSGAGQCSGARGIAVDNETGRLYVADRSNNRIAVFEEDGGFVFAFGWGVDTGAAELETCTTASDCQAGIAGAGPGQLNAPTKIAVDNGPGSGSLHAVYVVDEPNRRVQKFDQAGQFVWMVGEGVDKTDGGDLCTKAEGNTCGAGAVSSAEGGFDFSVSVGVGPGGVVHVLDNIEVASQKFKHRLQRFQEDGTPIPPQCILAEGLGRARDMAVDSGSNTWVANEQTGRGVRKYDPSCAELVLAEDTDRNNVAIAVDETDKLFAVQSQETDEEPAIFIRVLAGYEPSGQLINRFGYDKLPGAEGIAVLKTSALTEGEGGVFTSSSAGIRRLDFPPPPPTLPLPGPVVVPSSLEAKEIGPTKATLRAEVNPEGKETQVHFEYVDEATYEKDIEEGGDGFAGAESSEAKKLGIENFELEAFEELIGCLDPATESEEPENNCLTPETKYHWRVVATNADGGGEGTLEGPVFETTGSLELREVYATEVGTDTARLHAEANPHSIPATGFFEYVADAAFQKDIEEDGDGFAEASKAPDVDAEQAPIDFGAGDGFITRSIVVHPLVPGTTYHYRFVGQNPLIEPIKSEPETIVTFEPAETDPCPANAAFRIGAGALLPDCRAYEMVSPVDKAGGDIQVLKTSRGEPAVLEQSAESGEKLAYGSYRAFGDAKSAPVNSQYIAQRIAGKEWETHSINSPRERPVVDALGQFNSEFKAFTADLCQAWVTAFAEPPLAEGGVPDMINLYRRSDRLCGPEGYEALAPGLSPESGDFGGISADGGHAIFSTNRKLTEEGSEGTPQLYESVGAGTLRFVCILPSGEALGGSCAAGSNTVSAEPGPLSAISEDGQEIFWSDKVAGEGKLYVRIGGTQTVAVSKAAEEESGTSKSWFWGAARDGSKAIFSTADPEAGISDLYEFDVDSEEADLIAEGAIGVMGMSEDAGRVYFASSEALAPGAEAGEANLYLHEAGEGGGSIAFIATLASVDVGPAVSPARFGVRNARVSPDGGHAAFTSVEPLTGYDNTDAASAASCGEAGGICDTELFRYDAEAEELLCVSCNPSGARPAGAASIPGFQTPTHATRVLAEDGSRLYFQSADRLVARDANGKVDVYQWEEPGTGGCGEAEADFSAAAGGCVSLISAGEGAQHARFVEASPSGNDVFFATAASLLPQDPGVFDIYDARVGGGLPIPPSPPPPCEGDTCAAQIPAPEPPSPASSGLPPAGESAAPARKKRCSKGKRRVRRKGKARCVAKRKKQHRRRAAR